jgi:hypothetical protein
VTRGDEEGLIEEVQRHAWKAHRMTLSHDEALVLVLRAELGASRLRLLARHLSAVPAGQAWDGRASVHIDPANRRLIEP